MVEQIPLEPGVIEGVTKPTIDKLLAAGVPTVQALSTMTAAQIAEKSGMTEDTAEKAIRKAVQMVSEGFITADTLRESRKDRMRLKTGSGSLDELLGGGLESQTTTEISGAYAGGKSQVCHCIAVLAQLPVEQGGFGGEVAWIDTEDTFRSERITEIATNRGLEPEKILKGIHWAMAANSNHQKLLIEQLFDLCSKYPIKLIIVDSVMGHLRSEFIGRGTLSSRQGELADMLQTLLKVALSTKATVVYTNQVLANPAVMYGNPESPTGGNIMGHAAMTRLWLRKGKDNRRIAKLIDSSYLPPGEATFLITEMGIQDVDEKQKEEKEE